MARRTWSAVQPDLDVEKLVFVDETWTSTNADAPLWSRAPRDSLMHRIGPVWRLANSATFLAGLRHNPIDGAPGRRRANGWRTVPGLGTAISVSHIAARGHRDPRQPQQPQGGWSEGSHYCGAGHAALSAAVFARPEPHRKVFRQTQSAASSSRRAQRRLPLGRKSVKCFNTVSSTECTHYFASSGYVCT